MIPYIAAYVVGMLVAWMIAAWSLADGHEFSQKKDVPVALLSVLLWPVTLVVIIIIAVTIGIVFLFTNTIEYFLGSERKDGNK